jgi:hypothetical protein
MDFKRAVPWDSYLQSRRENFLQVLHDHLGPGAGNLNVLDRVSIINTNLPGAFTGIRNVSIPFESMTGYSRQALLQAIQHELRTAQDTFPGKLIQIGLFITTDCPSTCQPTCDPACPDAQLWKWLYRDASNSTDANGVRLVSLFDEFNGIRRPRVSFFQEDLAASRTQYPAASPAPTPLPSSNAPNYVTPPSSTAYTLFPTSSNMPSFAYYATPSIDSYSNGATFQANTPWSDPFMSTGGAKLTKTINGSPNDGMEAAFNAYLSEYLEVYLPDIDQAQPQGAPTPPPTLNAVLWKGELQSWKDYTDHLRSLAPLEAPAGLSVVRNTDNTNTITWYAVYAPVDATPVTYTVNRRMGMNWTPVTGCSSITATQCTDNSATGTSYAYQVKAVKGANITPYSYVAGFLSEGSNDGYVSSTTAFPTTMQPGIRVGEDLSGSDIKGILSFLTGSLNMGTVLTAKLRMDQVSSSTVFGTLGECFVDIKKGTFGNVGLEAADFSANPPSAAKVAQILPLPSTLTPPNWVETYLDANGISNVNTTSTGHTQFRIYFNHVNVSNTYASWYSGEANISGSSTPPQLIVQYTP